MPPDSLDKNAPARSKWSRDAWLKAYSKHGTVSAACKVVRISRQTAYEARKREPEFRAAWEIEETAVTDLLEKTGVERALEGSDRLMEFFLKARLPGKYRESMRVEHGGTVKHEVEEGLDAEIERFLAANDAAGESQDGRGDSGEALARRSASGPETA